MELLERLMKDIDGHRMNIDNFNKELFENIDKNNTEFLESLGKTNEEIMENLHKLVGGIQEPVNSFMENIVPKAYNPFRD
jgi:hypothetical protein